jgi:hydrogenase maturation protease
VRAMVAGIGNVFLGDDGFGVAVAQRLAGHEVPDGVRVADVGIRGLHLAYDLLDGCELLVLVDAVPLGEAPGTVAVIEVDPDDVALPGQDPVASLDAHTMSPVAVLGTLRAMGGRVDRVLVVGCEPATLEGGIGLSPPVAAAVDRAAEVVVEVLAAELTGTGR